MRSFVIAFAGAIPLVLIGGFSKDMRNPTVYGTRAWLDYPSLAKSIVLRRGIQNCENYSCLSNRPSEIDISLIVQRTKPHEPVAIFDLLDWTYHISAARPPLAAFLPSAVMFTEWQLSQYHERLRKAPYLFIAAGKDGKPMTKDTLLENWPLSEDYVIEARGEKLLALRRRRP